MRAIGIILCSAALLIAAEAHAAFVASDELVITQTGPSDLLSGLPIDIVIPETLFENQASVTLSRQSTVPIPTFSFSVFLLEQHGPGLISDIVNISGGPDSLGGPRFTITAMLISDSEGEVLDPIPVEVGRTPETGSLQDLSIFFAAPLTGVLGAPLPIDIAASSDVSVPEPVTGTVLGIALLGLAVARRRTRPLPPASPSPPPA